MNVPPILAQAQRMQTVADLQSGQMVRWEVSAAGELELRLALGHPSVPVVYLYGLPVEIVAAGPQITLVTE